MRRLEPGTGLMAAMALIAAACASQGMPPGGPPDVAPPLLVSVSPESGSLNVRTRAVTFTFDEVISERPRGAPTLTDLVVISPSDGPPEVSWQRTRLVVRPHSAWRPNTAYTVTVLAGLSDLRNNATPQAVRTVFATGNAIPTGTLSGVAFDWMAGRPAPKARVDATILPDTLLRYAIAADSLGRFSLGSLPDSVFLVRAWADANSNGRVDFREPWDTVTMRVSDTGRHDFYMIAHDTLGALLARAVIVDSVTIRLTFDHGLRTNPPFTVAQVRVEVARDSTALAVRRVLAAAAYDSTAARARTAREDSILRADTSAAGQRARARRDSLRLAQQRDSAGQRQIDSLRALRDTAKREPAPRLDRPIPPTTFVVEMNAPLPADTTVRITVTDVQAMEGPPRTSNRLVIRERAAARDTTRRPPAHPRASTPPRTSP